MKMLGLTKCSLSTSAVSHSNASFNLEAIIIPRTENEVLLFHNYFVFLKSFIVSLILSSLPGSVLTDF